MDLSVVFVTRNEEEHIEGCIRSTMAAVLEAQREGLIRNTEYILVDSASTDRTAEIASQFPVRIVRLESDWPLSCGAGCYVGLLHARGTFAAIVNGDMVIDRRWFADILPLMTEDVGAVCGVAKEVMQGVTSVERLLVGDKADAGPKDAVGYSTGTLIVRSAAARAVGSYNPFFRAAEDTDLRYRLARGGWKVRNSQVYQGKHHWASEGESLDLLSYFRTLLRNSVGLGQMARYNLGRDDWVSRQAAQPVLNARLLIETMKGTAFAILVALNVLAALGSGIALAGALIGDSTFVARIVLLSRRSRLRRGDAFFRTVVHPLLFSLVRTLGFLRGYAIAPKGPAEYPARGPA